MADPIRVLRSQTTLCVVACVELEIYMGYYSCSCVGSWIVRGLAVVSVFHGVDVQGTDANATVLHLTVPDDPSLCRRLMLAGSKVAWKQKAIWAPLSSRRGVPITGNAHLKGWVV